MVPFQTIPPSESFGRSEFFDKLNIPYFLPKSRGVKLNFR